MIVPSTWNIEVDIDVESTNLIRPDGIHDTLIRDEATPPLPVNAKLNI